MAGSENVYDSPQMLEVKLLTADAHDDTMTLCKHHHTGLHTTERRQTEITVTIVRQSKPEMHCATCNFTPKSKKRYNRHMQSQGHLTKSKHKNDNKCNICNAKALSDFKKCPMCNYTSDNTKNLKLHLNIHNKGLPFKCSFCSYAAQNIQSLMEHHRSATKYCKKGYCEYSTHKAEDLKGHKKVCLWRT